MRASWTKILCVSCLLILSLQQIAGAATPPTQERLQRAATAYSRGDYAAAITGYEALTEQGLSAALFYNLANSYAQAGQSGRAILNYERALRLAPSDADIRGNLELVRKEKGLFQEERSVQQRFVDLLGLNQWIVLLVASLVFLAQALLLPSALALKRSLRYGLAGAALLFGGLAAVGVAGQYGNWQDGVVIASEARLRISPFDGAASVGMIQEGRLLRPGKRYNEYVLITDESGRSGWLKASFFEEITAIP
jgi:tetratricopeptide (TPR) repeat protein